MIPQDEELIRKANTAFRNVLVSMPHLCGLVELIDFRLDTRVPTAGVFASGKMLFNPGFLEGLNASETTFVLAHELMHLILLTHERGVGQNAKLVNIAHDLIINHQLEKSLGMKTPAEGLRYQELLYDWKKEAIYKNFSNTSLEELIRFLRKNQKHISGKAGWPSEAFNRHNTSHTRSIGQAILNVLNEKEAGLPEDQHQEKWDLDVFTNQQEQKLFPNETKKELELKTAQMKSKVFESISLEAIQEKISNTANLQNKGSQAGNQSFTFQALQDHYAPPWQWAMQQWMEVTTPARNSYSRPSRRGQYENFVRPGKLRDGFTLHMVLDTSGSMIDVMPKVLAVISSFCKSMNIFTVHIIQCDTEISADEWVGVEALDNFSIKGLGGSDMSAGMYQLATDPEVERIIVITDGYINYPTDPLPYDTLWVLTADGSYYNDSFDPGYGRIIKIEEG